MKKTIAIICTLVLLLTTVFVPMNLVASADSTVVTTESEVLSANAGAYGSGYGVINYDFIPQLDMSGSDGTLILRYWADVNAKFHTPTTAIYLNGKSFKLPEWFEATTEKQDLVINLADYGMTDEDLKKVEAVVIHVSSQGEQSNFYVQLAVPTVPEEEPKTTESEVLSANAGAYGSGYGVINYDFIPTLDMSGSDGTLILRYWADVSAKFHTPTTAIYLNGKSFKLPEWFEATTEKQDLVINLADYGMTDEDLKKVEAVVIHVSSQGEQSNFYVQLAVPTVPEEEPKTTESEVLSADAGANGQSYGVINYDFIPTLDMSGSDGTLILRYWADVNAKFHTPTTAIYLNGKSFKLPEWFEATTEKQDYVINLADHGMTDEDLKKVEAVVIYVSSQGEQSNFYVQLAVPEEQEIPEPVPAVKATSYTSEAHLIGNNWDSYKTFETTFEAPLDMSGSNGTLEISQWVQYGGHITHIVYLEIFINGKSVTVDYNGAMPSTKETTVIALENYGLTDEDLKNVTGYKLHAGSDAWDNYFFEIEAPRAPAPAVKVSSYTSEAHLIGNNWDSYKAFETTFEAPLDMSGSDGTLKVSQWVQYGGHTTHILYLEIYINGKSVTVDYNGAMPSTKQTTTIALADYGLTDEDLKNVTGYKLYAGSDAWDNYFFEIEAPQVPTGDAEKLVWLKKALFNEQYVPANDINGDGNYDILDLIALKNSLL